MSAFSINISDIFQLFRLSSVPSFYFVLSLFFFFLPFLPSVSSPSPSPSLSFPSLSFSAFSLFRGSVAGVFSVLQHATCPENIVFHFIATRHRHLPLPPLAFRLYQFDCNLVTGKISYSVRRALDQPLNYARIYLVDLLPAGVRYIIYFDSDFIVVNDVAKL